MTKQFVVLLYNDGHYTIAADYGDYAWGAATYQVIGYWPSRQQAQEAIRAHRILSR